MSSKSISHTEARQLVLQQMQTAEEKRKQSAIDEAKREARNSFSQYGEAALTLMADLGGGVESEDGLNKEEFEVKYGVSKQEVCLALIYLQLANERKDYNRRDEMYDFFISIL